MMYILYWYILYVIDWYIFFKASESAAQYCMRGNQQGVRIRRSITSTLHLCLPLVHRCKVACMVPKKKYTWSQPEAPKRTLNRLHDASHGWACCLCSIYKSILLFNQDLDKYFGYALMLSWFSSQRLTIGHRLQSCSDRTSVEMNTRYSFFSDFRLTYIVWYNI